MSQWQAPDEPAPSGWSAPEAAAENGSPHGWGAEQPTAQVPPTGEGPAWERPSAGRADAAVGAAADGRQPGATNGWGAPVRSAPQPGIVPLRPLSLGEIWDGAFRAFRQNPRVMVGLSAIVVVATTAVSLLGTVLVTRDITQLSSRLGADASAGAAVSDALGSLQQSLPLFLLGSILQGISVLVLNGLLIVAVSRAVLGRSITLGELWRTTRGRVLSLVGLSLLLTTITVSLLIVCLAPGVLVLVLASSEVTIGLGVVLLLLGAAGWAVLAVWLTIRWTLATPALLLEGLSVRRAMRRSVQLIRGSFWRTFGILALTGLVAYFVVLAISVPFSAAGSLVGLAVLGGSGAEPSTGATILQEVIASLGSIIGSVVAYPFLASVTALVYVDLRMRREGLDVELHRAAAG